MTEIVENNIKIKFCKTCGISSDINKFQPKRKVCIKCVSKQNNERLKEKQYFKNYYDENRDVLLPKYIKYYADIVKPVRKIVVK